MTPWITRMAAWSAAGWGLGPLTEALARGEPLLRAVPYVASGLRSPFACLLPDRVEAAELLEALILEVLPDAPGRCGLVVATSSGAISGAFERWHAARVRGVPVRPHAWRQEPGQKLAKELGLAPHTTVSVACASGSVAFEIARGWLRQGRCDHVVVVGYEVLSLYIHAGFAGLGALAAEQSRPFRQSRDGLVLGEGGASFLLEKPSIARQHGRSPMATLLGCGLSQDGVHLTAPDRTGSGIFRASAAALSDARVQAGQVDVVSAHATGTPFNDAMESRGLSRLFEGPVPLHAAKPVIGHCLGAAGALEAAALVAMLQGAESPAAPTIDAEDCPIVFRPVGSNPRIGLSVNAAFGGVNAALVFGRGGEGTEEAEALPRRVVSARTVSLDQEQLPLADIHPQAPVALGRADTYVRAGIALLHQLGPASETPVVLSSTTNCAAADLRYHEGLLRQGPAGASRIHFTYTTPGSPLAEASILEKLRGPAIVLCDGPEAGQAEARRLVEQGAPCAIALHLECPAGHATGTATEYRLGDVDE